MSWWARSQSPISRYVIVGFLLLIFLSAVALRDQTGSLAWRQLSSQQSPSPHRRIMPSMPLSNDVKKLRQVPIASTHIATSNASNLMGLAVVVGPQLCRRWLSIFFIVRSSARPTRMRAVHSATTSCSVLSHGRFRRLEPAHCPLHYTVYRVAPCRVLGPVRGWGL